MPCSHVGYDAFIDGRAKFGAVQHAVSSGDAVGKAGKTTFGWRTPGGTSGGGKGTKVQAPVTLSRGSSTSHPRRDIREKQAGWFAKIERLPVAFAMASRRDDRDGHFLRGSRHD